MTPSKINPKVAKRIALVLTSKFTQLHTWHIIQEPEELEFGCASV